MTIKKRIATLLLVLVVILAIGGELLLSLFAVKANAAEGTSTTYSNVLDDLKKDSNFNPDDYPALTYEQVKTLNSDENPDNDVSLLSVIQAVEGDNGELFIYVYQPINPSKSLKAAKINMSLQRPTDEDIQYKLYNLTWLNSNGVFVKYLVNGFEISDSPDRYYSVTTIYRPFDSSLNDVHDAELDDLTNFKAHPVAKSWRAYDYNGQKLLESQNMLYVDVEITSVGFTRYSGGFGLIDTACDSHFIAFKIENFDASWVYDADVCYTTCDRSVSYITGSKENKETVTDENGNRITYIDGIKYVDGKDIPVDSYTVFADDEKTYKGSGWFAHEYSWNRIVTIDTFKTEIKDHTNEFISPEHENGLNNAQFVIRFLETDYEMVNHDYGWNEYSTYVSNVSILRLKFLTKNGVYNLGVVSDIVSDDGNPDFIADAMDGLKNNIEDAMDWLKVILTVVVIILLFTVFGGLVSFILRILYDGFKFLLKLAWWLVTFPFRLIAFFFK